MGINVQVKVEWKYYRGAKIYENTNHWKSIVIFFFDSFALLHQNHDNQSGSAFNHRDCFFFGGNQEPISTHLITYQRGVNVRHLWVEQSFENFAQRSAGRRGVMHDRHGLSVSISTFHRLMYFALLTEQGKYETMLL